jgi:Holliday junction resolvasome RuvABC DNA-binding subunit
MDSIPDLDSSDDEEIINSSSEEQEKLLSLVKMGYTESEASITIE